TLSTGDTRTVWQINFREFVQLRAKFDLFTYARFDIEFTLLATFTKSNSSSAAPVQLQVMYVPPGAIAPTDQDTYQWQTAANPSVFFQANGVPARFSIPYVGTASAYSFFYDGYSQFGGEAPGTSYGVLGSNGMGALALRALAPLVDGESVKLRVYAKPKHTRVWGPRAPRIRPYLYKASNVFTAETKMVPDRTSITTTGAFGQQSGAVFVGNYKIMNRHLASQVEWDSLEWEDYNRDVIVSRVNAHGADKLARCKCNAGVYYCKSRGKHYPVIFEGPGIQWIDANDYYPARYQSHILLGIGFCEPGDCGGILRCQHGVIGIITAGGPSLVAFADLRDLFWIEH
nr:2A [Sichuan takin enterovirus]